MQNPYTTICVCTKIREATKETISKLFVCATRPYLLEYRLGLYKATSKNYSLYWTGTENNMILLWTTRSNFLPVWSKYELWIWSYRFKPWREFSISEWLVFFAGPSAKKYLPHVLLYNSRYTPWTLCERAKEKLKHNFGLFISSHDFPSRAQMHFLHFFAAFLLHDPLLKISQTRDRLSQPDISVSVFFFFFSLTLLMCFSMHFK